MSQGVDLQQESSSANEPPPSPELLELATRCEGAGFAQQGECLAAAIAQLDGWHRRETPDGASEMLERARDCMQATAWESAALALVPSSATVTGGRMASAGVVAQVVLADGTGAHSRDARWLAMAVIAALLRAVARQVAHAAAPAPASIGGEDSRPGGQP